MANITPHRVGVIGVGVMGIHHARNYACLPNAELVAVADISSNLAQSVAERFHCRPYTDYREMLVCERPEAVSIAVPTSCHYQVGMDAIHAGAHVLMEKPIASNSQAAIELVKEAHARGLVLAVGHIERFNPAVQELKRRMEIGDLGNISSIVARRVGVMPPRIKDVNVILDLAVHDIDIACYLLGCEPSQVAAGAGSALLSNNRYDHTEIFLKFGMIGCFIQANWITPIKIRTLSVTGDAGHAELNYVTQHLEIFQDTLDRQFDDFGDFVVRFGTPQSISVEITPREPLQLELENFLLAVEGKPSCSVNGEEAIRALSVAESVLATVKQDRMGLPAARGLNVFQTSFVGE